MGPHHPQFVAEFTVEAFPIAWPAYQFYPAQNEFSASAFAEYRDQVLQRGEGCNGRQRRAPQCSDSVAGGTFSMPH